ncbi:Pinopsin, partial [Eudyptes chrysolophus]
SSSSLQEPPNNGALGPFDSAQWPHQAPQGMYLPVAVLTGIAVVSALVVNGLVIMVSIRYKKLQSPLNYILVNLAVADLLVTLCGSPVSFSNINGFFMFGKPMRELEAFMVSLTGIVGLWSLAILAFGQYIVVCRPLGDFRFQHRHAVSGCASTWSWSLLRTTPPLLGWSSYVPEGLRTSCGPNWYTGGSNNSYILALFVTCFMMPLSLTLFSYTNLLRTLRAAAAQQQGTDMTRQAEQGVTRMVIAMVVAFLICWLPYTTFALVVAANKDIAIQPALASLPSYFSKTAKLLPRHVTRPFPAQLQSCLLKMVCCGYHPWEMGKTAPAAPVPPPGIAADGLRNKVTLSRPV